MSLVIAGVSSCFCDPSVAQRPKQINAISHSFFPPNSFAIIYNSSWSSSMKHRVSALLMLIQVATS